MYKINRILGIISAGGGGGSKGLPNKNIRTFLGKPLIAWTINQAKKSKYIDKLIVSTNDEKIAKISIEHGADIPFMRPEEEDIQCVEKPN
jgi:CMP-N-acetylneuraminic acid synthetase